MKKLLIGGLLLVTALCAIGLVVIGHLPALDRGRAPSPRSPDDAAAELRQALTAESQAATKAAAPPIPSAVVATGASNPEWWQPPLPEVFEMLQAKAERGDMQAAYVLGSRSAECMNRIRNDSPDKLLEDYRQDIAIDESGRDLAPRDRERLNANRDRQFASRLKRYEECAVLGEDALAGHLEWLERAGASGIEKARLAYARYALAECESDRGALIADIETAARRRERAVEWLGQLVADGNEDALNMLVESPEISGLAADRVALMSYRYTLDLVRSRRVGKFPALWEAGPARYGDEFTAQQWDQIATRGRRIFREDFEDAPLWPGR